MKKLLINILRLFNYAGIEKNEFSKIEDEFRKTNREHIKTYSAVVFAFYLVLAAANIVTDFYNSNNTYIYIGTAAAMLIILVSCLLTGKNEKDNPFITDIFTYGFMSVLYLSAILLSLNHPEMPAVSYIGILIVLPLLFAERPVNIAMHQLVFVVLFCILVKIYKTPFIAGDDIWNVLSFYAVSIIASVIVMPMRVKNILNTSKLEFFSEHDILTGVKNRNSYELFTAECKTKSTEGLICVYADVNGLHELNNERGNAAGDEMLKTVAQGIKTVFGEESSYRIGGDEFVAFNNFFDEYELREKLKNIRTSCEKKGYYVSFGFAGPWDGCESVCRLVSLAETRMYEAKREFYREHTEFDRRR